MVEDIQLLAGNIIPLFSANVVLVQPTIKEIAFMGEENFFLACQLLNFSKDLLSEEDRNNLSDINDFDILMSMLVDEENLSAQRAACKMLLGMIFPDYEVEFQMDGIHLHSDEHSAWIGRESFAEFQEIIKAMFALEFSTGQDFKPASEKAKQIAAKLKQGRQKVASAKGEDKKKIAIFSRYISILGVALGLDINVLSGYTVYQITDQFKRFQAKESFDINIQARMAGATDLEEKDHWMEDIHSLNTQ